MRMPEHLRERSPKYDKPPIFSHTRPGGTDPAERLEDMAVDYITAEVLYPSIGAKLFSEKDPELAQALARVYNDWLIEYCQHVPERLWGLAGIPLWNIDFAVKEMERCRKSGLVGAGIWLAPPDELPFYSPHYNRFWAAAQDLEMPVSLHINSGFGFYNSMPQAGTVEGVTLRVHGNSNMAKDALGQIILSGVLERFPRLAIVIGEVNWGWAPFWLQELDENYQRYIGRAEGNSANTLAKLAMLPSEYYQRQCYMTFMDDTVGGYVANRWLHGTAMWSNDYPHWNGIWPLGTEILNRTLEPLSPDKRYDVVCGNVARLYKKSVPAPLPRTSRTPKTEEMPARVQRNHRRHI
jgi:predicted TIM-barrel fold metal-dependent hydrolase